MKKFRVTLETTYSGYSNRFAETEKIFIKEFETKKEAQKFFRTFAKENDLKNTVYSNTKLGFYNKKQVELTII